MSDINTLAELIRPDDTLRFKLFAQKAIVQDDARITVEVHALVRSSLFETCLGDVFKFVWRRF